MRDMNTTSMQDYSNRARSEKNPPRMSFEAIGKPVPQHKKDEALRHVQEMMPDADSELHKWIVGKAASLIEKDMLFSLLGEVHILDEGLDKLDLIGRYRLAAVLLA